MDNKLSIIMFIAMIGYAIFCAVKCRQLASAENNKNNNKYFGMVVVGLFVGLAVGFLTSPILTEILFTKNYLKTHSNSDLGLFGFYALITFALMVIMAIFPMIITTYILSKKKSKTA